MDTLLQDLRFAFRTLLKSRGFTAVAVLCIGLGIGVNSTLFSVVYGALIKPFPFARPEQLVVPHGAQPKNKIEGAGVSYLDFLDWREQSKAFSAMGAYGYRSLTVAGTEEPERLQGATISASLFPMLGVRPVIGRNFHDDEDRPGGEPVVLIGHDFWQRRFNGDASVIGHTLTVNQIVRTIVGVMPAGFRFPQEQDMWVPLAPLVRREARGSRDLTVIARLRPGITREAAEHDLVALTERQAALYPQTNTGWSVAVWPLRRELIGDESRLIVLAMMGAVSFVLLIACANVANLLLARATARSRELAIRFALGAGRQRIIRQLLTESVLVALGGAVLGALLAVWGVELVTRSISPNDPLPYYIHWSVELPELLYTLGLALFTGILFGLAPALQASGDGLANTLKEGSRGSGSGVRGNRLRGTLVIAEVALSLVLLVGATLFIQTFANFERASTGFDTSRIMTMRFYMPGDAYSEGASLTRRVEDIIRRVEALPGVQAAVASNQIPLDNGGGNGAILLEGRSVARGEEPYVFYSGVTSHFFETFGLRLAAGRPFSEHEASDSSGLAVVNQTFAKKFWPGDDPIGHRVRFLDDTTVHWITVIGVVTDFKNGSLNRPTEPSVFLPYPYLPARNSGLAVRTAGDPAQITAAVRREIRASDPGLPIFEVFTMTQLRRNQYWQFGLFSWMFSIFAAIALFLAAVGVYGVVSFAVGQRTREIGVRVALGAQQADVLRMVIGQGAALALAGVGVGVLGALAVTRVVASMLFNVSPTDPVSFAGIALLLTTVALLASWIPARRAMRVDPLVALKAE
jgi:putative ABC transport system permease protein